jgi:hypothetical protein
VVGKNLLLPLVEGDLPRENAAFNLEIILRQSKTRKERASFRFFEAPFELFSFVRLQQRKPPRFGPIRAFPSSILSANLIRSLSVCATLEAIMLIEAWERLRGYDKWIQTEATIKSSQLDEVEVARVRTSRYGDDEPIMEWQSTCSLAWTDNTGRTRTADYEVSESSSLFQLYDGQTETIRYNPANPDEYYIRDLLRDKVVSTLKWKVGPARGVAGLLAVYFFSAWLRHIDASH